jgi:hypothetical protein
MQLSNSIELIGKIKDLYQKLENDKLSSEEIDRMVSLSRNLHERCVILRYKAFEQKVFGQGAKKLVLMEDEIIHEAKKEEAKSKLVGTDAIDFSIFEDGEENLIADEPIKELKIEFEEMAKEETKSIVEEIKEPIVEESIIEKISETDEAPIQNSISQELKIEEPIPAKVSNVNWEKMFTAKLQERSGGFQPKLDSLIGSFGLNERLLYINELFDGSSELFSEAIKELDRQGDWNTCVRQLGNLANTNLWDKDSDTIGEFVVHVNRKYA